VKVAVPDVSASASQPVDSNLRETAPKASSAQPSLPTSVIGTSDGQLPRTQRPPRVVPRSQSSDNKASDALREEQLARMRAAAAAR
jgi:hypothetical protein